MATKDITANADSGHGVYTPSSPFGARAVEIDFATTTVGASGADTVNLMPLNKGEFVQAAYLRVDTASSGAATVKLDDSRTGGGAILAAEATNATGTTAAAGAGLGAVGSDDGFLTLTTVAAVALADGKATVYAVIGNAF